MMRTAHGSPSNLRADGCWFAPSRRLPRRGESRPGRPSGRRCRRRGRGTVAFLRGRACRRRRGAGASAAACSAGTAAEVGVERVPVIVRQDAQVAIQRQPLGAERRPQRDQSVLGLRAPPQGIDQALDERRARRDAPARSMCVTIRSNAWSWSRMASTYLRFASS